MSKIYKHKFYSKNKKINIWKYNKYNKLNSKKNIILKLRLLNKNNFYNKKLIDKQYLKGYLGKITEKQFKKNLLCNIIEKRLDFVLYKSNFLKSIYMSRFCITKGLILVNNIKITKPSYILKKNDIIEINPKYWNYFYNNILRYFIYLYNNNYYFYYKTIKNIEVDFNTLSIIYLNDNNNIINNFNIIKSNEIYNIITYNNKLKRKKYNINKSIFIDNYNIQMIKRFYK